MEQLADRHGRGYRDPQNASSRIKRFAASVRLIAGLLFVGFVVLGAAPPQAQTPSLTVIPSSGPRGTVIIIVGENFTGNGSVANGIAIDGVSTGNPLFSLTTDGNFVYNGIVVLAAGTGPKAVTVTDSGGLTGSATFTVTRPTITLSPATVTLGETVTIAGAGWVPLSSVFITLDADFQEVAGSVAIVDATGGFATTMEIPRAVGIGKKVISFEAADTSNLGNTAEARELTIPAPKITISATEAVVGSTVTLDASAFLPNSALTDLSIGGLDVGEGVPTTDSVGSLTVSFTVPGLNGGQIVSVSIGGTTITMALIVDNSTVPPVSDPAPEPVASQTTEVFADLISNGGNLIRIFRFDNATQAWDFFDPRPEFAGANSLTTTVPGDIVWVNVVTRQDFQGGTLFPGWNLVSLK